VLRTAGGIALAVVIGVGMTACYISSSPLPGTVIGGKPDSTLPDLEIDVADIILKHCGNQGAASHVNGNKFKLTAQADLSNVGFYYEFPEEVVGKGYGAINIEMEVISITRPDFIGLMTFSSTQFSGSVNVIDKDTGQQKTGQYDNEFKLGKECVKGAAGDTAEGGDGILDGSSEVGVKRDVSYPFAKFTDKIVFQVNRYAGNITTADWTQASTDAATFEIAVTKITFVGAGPGDSVVDLKAIAGVTPPATGNTPVTAITETAQYTGTVTWAETLTDAAAGAAFADSTAYTATITLTAKEGFTLTGVAANFFTVAGATSVSNAADSGVVIAKFPATVPPATDLTVTVDGVAKQIAPANFKGHAAAVQLLNDGSGVEYTAGTGSNTGYDWSYFVFKLDLQEALTNFTKIAFTVTGTTYKEVWVRAGNADITGYMGSTAEAVLFTATGNTLEGDPDLELAINATEAALATGTDLFFAIDVRIGSGDTITITDIAFIK